MIVAAEAVQEVDQEVGQTGAEPSSLQFGRGYKRGACARAVACPTGRLRHRNRRSRDASGPRADAVQQEWRAVASKEECGCRTWSGPRN